MKKSIVCLMLLMVFGIGAALAQEAPVSDNLTDGLNEVQKAEIALKAAQMKRDSKTLGSSVPAPEQAKEWVEVGSAIGDGLAAAAENIGVSADKILDTKAGMLVAIIIVWNYMGSSILGAMIFVVWLACALPAWFYAYKRRFIWGEIVYTYKDKEEKIPKTKQIVLREGKADETAVHFMYWFTMIIIIGIGILGIGISLA